MIKWNDICYTYHVIGILETLCLIFHIKSLKCIRKLNNFPKIMLLEYTWDSASSLPVC